MLVVSTLRFLVYQISVCVLVFLTGRVAIFLYLLGLGFKPIIGNINLIRAQ